MKINGIRFNPIQLCSLLCLEASIKSAHLVIIDNTFLVLFVQSKEDVSLFSSIFFFKKSTFPDQSDDNFWDFPETRAASQSFLPRFYADKSKW